MFKNRRIVTESRMTKVKRGETHEEPEEDRFEEKADYLLKKLGRIGFKVFIAGCALIVLDTARQIAIEKSKSDSTD